MDSSAPQTAFPQSKPTIFTKKEPHQQNEKKYMKTQSEVNYDNESAVFRDQLYRVEGEDYNSLIHRSIVAISFLGRNKQIRYGSGVLISRNIILTAASNIYDRKTKRQYSDIRVYETTRGQGEKYQSVREWRYPQNFKHCPEQYIVKFNFAIIKLVSSIFFDKYLPLSLPCACSFASQIKNAVSVFGFPDTYGNYPQIEQIGKIKLCQYGLTSMDTNIAIDNTRSQLKYQISTLSGLTGCPVIVGDSIIGINGFNRQFVGSVGRVVDVSLINKIMEWIQQIQHAQPANVRFEGICTHAKPKIQRIKMMASRNKTQHLDFSQYTDLQDLTFSNTNVDSIKLSHCFFLTKLVLTNNQLSSFEPNNLINLTHLHLYFNKLQNIDLGANINLTDLNLSANKLKTIDLRTNLNIRFLNLSFNQLSTIDVKTNINLTYIDLSGNKFFRINLSNNSKLNQLYLYKNKIVEIDLRDNKQLLNLKLEENKLARICLPIAANKTNSGYSNTNGFNFSHQQSPACRVQLICNEQAARQKAEQVAAKWRQQYADQKRNKYQSKYCFQVL